MRKTVSDIQKQSLKTIKLRNSQPENVRESGKKTVGVKHLRKTHPTHYQTIGREINRYLIKKTPIYKKKNVLLRKFLRDTTNQQHKRTLTQWSQRIKHREYTNTTGNQRVSNNTTTTRIKTIFMLNAKLMIAYQTIPQQQGRLKIGS